MATSPNYCFHGDPTGAVCLLTVFIIISYFILNHVIERFKQEDPKLFELRQHLRRIRPEVADQLVLLEDQKSYTINKKKIYMCLRDEKGEYYHDNMLVFVVLHELAHVLCDEIGHTEKFHSIFQQLLKEAEEQKIYDPKIAPTERYCEYSVG